MYVMVCIGLDIAYTMGIMSRYISNLGKEHWTSIIKRVFKYLHGISSYAICYKGRPKSHGEIEMQGFVEVN